MQNKDHECSIASIHLDLGSKGELAIVEVHCDVCDRVIFSESILI